jgi:hypothetical protein
MERGGIISMDNIPKYYFGEIKSWREWMVVSDMK